MAKVKLSLRIINTSAKEVVVHVEPWGVQNAVESGGSYEFYIEGPNDETLEVEYGDRTITIYGWSGSTVSARTERRIESSDSSCV